VGKEVGNVARTLQKLTDVKVKSDKLKPGRHSDGGGLYLNVSSTGTKSWLFMWVPAGGKRREMGLGAYPVVTLAKARMKAAENRLAVENGRDPIADKDKEAEPTFGDCADKFLASMESSWRNAKHRAQWKMTLEEYAETLRSKKVSHIDTEDVLTVLKPIWADKAETASRLRGRIERVLSFAKAKGWRSGENPALWRGHLDNILPARQRLTRGHHAAMPYSEVSALFLRLKTSEATAARALEFTILNAARSGETYGAKWPEFDLAAAVWTIPAARMKAGKEHRVPLSDRSLEIVKHLHEVKVSDYVFPGQKAKRPLSNMAMEMLLRRMKVDHVTVHGFRSSFRDWAGDETAFSREIAEAALAHEIGNAVERAYRRADAIEKRRKLMQAWADYLANKKVGNVVNLDEVRKA
jgi:integrase